MTPREEAEVKDLREFKRDIEEISARVANDECAKDEKHCTCVPFLRAEVNRLEAAVEKALDEAHDRCLDAMSKHRRGLDSTDAENFLDAIIFSCCSVFDEMGKEAAAIREGMKSNG